MTDTPKTPDDEIYEILDLYENYLSCRTPSLTVDQAVAKLKAREARIETAARIDYGSSWLEAYMQATGIKSDPFIEALKDDIAQLKNNPMQDEAKGAGMNKYQSTRQVILDLLTELIGNRGMNDGADMMKFHIDMATEKIEKIYEPKEQAT